MKVGILRDRGVALPLGATRLHNGINFAIFSKNATHVWLALFLPGRREPIEEIPLDSVHHRTGQVWHIWLGALPMDVEYAWRMDMRPNPAPHLHRFDSSRYLLDPYAGIVSGGESWGIRGERRCGITQEIYDWGDDRPINRSLKDSVIYEMHVRGFTRDKSSGVSKPGTYAGLTEKIPYLKSLGITAVELLPVYEFEEANTDRYNPLLGTKLMNLWGYQPIAFFAPNSAYSASPTATGAVTEFRDMVKKFHAAGIEVILDVVFNHTAEGDEHGQTFAFRGIDNSVYYLLEKDGGYSNYSGCGNTFNCNHPVVRQLITDVLRYWVMEMHVDGFRFDLASILGRGVDGAPLPNPPLLEGLAYDPILSGTKLIAEAWDAAGLYQVGSFPAWGRWAEWNGKYRDDLRKFVKSDPGMIRTLAVRLAGSPDLYQSSGRRAQHSINFITCHDGFTLNDLVSYNEKHNEANGESNRDGTNDNHSWNCGVEGPSSEADVASLRRRQVRNFAALLFLSGGTPMLLAGDEFGRTQGGNNNAYCQDNRISWLDWTLLEHNADTFEFFQRMIALRQRLELFRHIDWASDAGVEHTEVRFHGVHLYNPDWGDGSRTLAVEYRWKDERVYLIMNSFWDTLDFDLPALDGQRWWRIVDSTLEAQEELAIAESFYSASSRSVVVLEAR